MKKNLTTISAIALAVISCSAVAGMNGGEVQFTGVVSNTTCDIGLVANGSNTNVIDLGTVGSGGKASTPVNFVLQPATSCTSAVTGGANPAPQTQASISFSGPFDSAGLKPTSGTATDARVKLTAVNSTTPNTAVTQSNNTATFSLNDLNKGASFNATLQSGTTSGDYHSSLVYAVTYK